MNKIEKNSPSPPPPSQKTKQKKNEKIKETKEIKKSKKIKKEASKGEGSTPGTAPQIDFFHRKVTRRCAAIEAKKNQTLSTQKEKEKEK